MVEQLLQYPDAAAAVKNLDAAGLRKIASLYQMEQHSALLGADMTDKETINNIVASCKGAAALVLWAESLKEELERFEAEERGVTEDGDDGQIF